MTLPPHGDRARYTRYGCRCVECRGANARYQAQRRKRLKRKATLAELIRVGDQVRHPHLGWGTVLAIDHAIKRLTVHHRHRRRTCEYRAKLVTAVRDRQRLISVLNLDEEGRTPANRVLAENRRRRGDTKLTVEEQALARDLWLLGWSQVRLAERFHVSKSTISRLLQR